MGDIQSCSVQDLDRNFNQFVRAAFTVTKRALPSLIENKGKTPRGSQTRMIGIIVSGIAGPTLWCGKWKQQGEVHQSGKLLFGVKKDRQTDEHRSHESLLCVGKA